MIIADAASKTPSTLVDGHEFAMPFWTQIRLVSRRTNVVLYRKTNFANNKLSLHTGPTLLNVFTFGMGMHPLACHCLWNELPVLASAAGA
jgi:hypothetical protein